MTEWGQLLTFINAGLVLFVIAMAWMRMERKRNLSSPRERLLKEAMTPGRESSRKLAETLVDEIMKLTTSQREGIKR